MSGARSTTSISPHKAPIAAEALKRIGRLFEVEREVNGLAPEARRQIRQARARPVIDDLAAFLDGSLPNISSPARASWPAPCAMPAGAGRP
jgi:Transposase IS66 family